MDKLIALVFLVQAIFPSAANAYLFERDTQTGNPVRLNATADNPKIYFRISGDAPQFKNKEKFLDGKYKNTDDANFFKAVVMEAMKKWTDVEDSYVELILSAESGPGKNPDDNINNISISSGSWSDAGSAMPIQGKTESDSQYIVDCDISLDAETDPERFSITVLHELGHCLGLLHPHYSSKSIMSYANRSNKFELTLDDKAGATVLYPVSYEKRKDLIPVCGSISAPKNAKNRTIPLQAFLVLPIMTFLAFMANRKKSNLS